MYTTRAFRFKSDTQHGLRLKSVGMILPRQNMPAVGLHHTPRLELRHFLPQFQSVSYCIVKRKLAFDGGTVACKVWPCRSSHCTTFKTTKLKKLRSVIFRMGQQDTRKASNEEALTSSLLQLVIRQRLAIQVSLGKARKERIPGMRFQVFLPYQSRFLMRSHS